MIVQLHDIYFEQFQIFAIFVVNWINIIRNSGFLKSLRLPLSYWQTLWWFLLCPDVMVVMVMQGSSVEVKRWWNVFHFSKTFHWQVLWLVLNFKLHLVTHLGKLFALTIVAQLSHTLSFQICQGQKQYIVLNLNCPLWMVLSMNLGIFFLNTHRQIFKFLNFWAIKRPRQRFELLTIFFNKYYSIIEDE